MFKAFRTLRARVLAIALVPSVGLLVIGGGGAVSLVIQGQQLRTWADEQRAHASPALLYSGLVQQERRLTLLRISGHLDLSAGLRELRPQVDASVRQMVDAAITFEKLNPGSTADASAGYEALTRELSAVRAKVDGDAISISDAYTFYNQLTDIVRTAMVSFAHSAPDTEIAIGLGTVLNLFIAAESLSRAHDLAIAAETTGGLSTDEVEEFGRQVGSYRNQMQIISESLTDDGRAQWQALTESPQWRTLEAIERALIQRGAPASADAAAGGGVWQGAGSDAGALPVSASEWEAAIVAVSDGMLRLWTGHAERVSTLTEERGDSRARESLLGGLLVLAITIAAFLTALRLSTRMIQRLHRLRAETIALTDDQLPAIIGALDRGEPVDLDKELTRLDFGDDEIGQVAEAFNRAQLAAVDAAATEARTRDGVNTVFLNIAHRSQVVLHRHLKLLDAAEHEQEDPKVLDLLFRLHHLATRERRNAENLIILGGEQPRRQWRNPVRLDELVRGAVAETEDFSRVRVVRLPEVKVSGSVIADLVHLLAELVDNATSFSPPDSQVTVSGNVVGRGVVVEVADQGLGMLPERMAELNETLSSPPDFALAALSKDNRLGMFVIARLAARIHVSVRLTESEYGGVKAVVLVPADLLTDVADAEIAARAIEPVARATAHHASASGLLSESGGGAIRQDLRQGESQAGASYDPSDRRHEDLRPELPRRQRRPESEHPPVDSGFAGDPATVAPTERSAEQARDLFSAIDNGTRQGRAVVPEPPYRRPMDGNNR